MKQYRILAINPGSTSTKVAVYEEENLLKELTLRHSAEELKDFKKITDQFEFRKQIILNAVADAGIDIKTIDAVIGRGGVLKPIGSGIYEVNDAMKKDLIDGPRGEHASNLGGLIADDIAGSIGVKAYIADPVVVDEMQDVARISGLPQYPRASIFHALNQKAMAREYASQHGVRYEELNLIIVHLGGGISVGAHQKGRVIDVNNCLDGEGPISPERCGTLPAAPLAKLCFSGEYTFDQVKKLIAGKGGMVAHLDTNNCLEAEKRADEGDKYAQLVIDAMCYTTAKEVGAMAAVLSGDVDAIILTGGIARDEYVCNYIKERVSFIAPVAILPGENELLALADNTLRTLRGEQQPKIY